MLEASVDDFSGAAGGTGAVEMGQGASRSWPTAVSPGASRPSKIVRSGPVKVVSGTSRSLMTVV